MKRPRRTKKIWILALLLLLLTVLAVPIGYGGWERTTLPPGAPLIGLSLDTSWYSRLGVTRIPYQMALVRAGARYLPFRHGDYPPEEILAQIDGLLLTGGGDIDPEFSGESKRGVHIDRKRDEFEMALVEGALERDLPVLGVCRGMQILNVTLGGSLQDLRDHRKKFSVHGIGFDSLWAHSVEIAPNSLLSTVSPASGRRVNSFHRHAIHRRGKGLQVPALSPDGTIEALEVSGKTFAIAVQWHPEWLALGDSSYLRIFRALVREAENYRKTRTTASAPIGRSPAP